MIPGLLKTEIPEQSIKHPFQKKGIKTRGIDRTKGLPVVENKELNEELSKNNVASDG